MSRKKRCQRGYVLLSIVVVIAATGGCGTSANGEGATDSPRILSTNEARELLMQTPYRYAWRKVALPEGASGALAGKAIGDHQTVVHFGVSLGTEAAAVPVPRAGVEDSYDYSEGGGFVFTADLEVPGKNGNVHPGRQFHTRAQWNEAIRMEVAIEEKLCKAATGRPCPP
jgi:hypothetical protein